MKIEQFSFKYDHKQLFEKANFYFEDNQMNVILGENGIGKSTLLDCIADVDGSRPKDFVGFPQFHEIAYLTQGNNFNQELTVQDILDFIEQLHEVRDVELPIVIDQLLGTRFGNLSGGERRLVLVYITTILDKQLYLFDEPEAGVDRVHSAEIYTWLRELINQGKTIILTTHKLDNILDTDNVNYIKDSHEVINSSYLQLKSLFKLD